MFQAEDQRDLITGFNHLLSLNSFTDLLTAMLDGLDLPHGSSKGAGRLSQSRGAA